MNHDLFETFGQDADESPLSRPVIPESAYRPVKRCPNCQSVYLTDTNCEACGRSLNYHVIGEPFSAKSLYGFKERYYASFPVLIKYFNIFEDKKGPSAQSYVRQLSKRFDHLIEAFGDQQTIQVNNRRYFYVEVLELIDELLRYGVDALTLQQKIEMHAMETGSLLTQELLLYLNDSAKQNIPEAKWSEIILSSRVMGLKIDHWLKVIIIAATVITAAVIFYEFISLQFGK